MNKREFLRTSGAAGLGLLLGDRVWARFAELPVDRLAEDEAFWAAIRAKYRLKPDYINLESGYYSMQATPVLEAFIAQGARGQLPGVVLPAHDAGAGQGRGARQARRDGRLLAGGALHHAQHHRVDRHRRQRLRLEAGRRSRRWPSRTTATCSRSSGSWRGATASSTSSSACPPIRRPTTRSCSVYANAITPRTRLLMVSHMINITGHILPVRKIADMAHARGVDVLVDGAHAFAHFDYKIPDLGGDYYAASLHKWLGCPLGTGILYVRRDKIPGALADLRRLADDRRRRHHEAESHRHASGAHGSRDRARHRVPQLDRHRSARKRGCATCRTTGPARSAGCRTSIMNTPSDPARARARSRTSASRA